MFIDARLLNKLNIIGSQSRELPARPAGGSQGVGAAIGGSRSEAPAS